MTLSPSSYFSHVMRSGRPTDQHQAEINQTTLITTENRKQRLRNFSLRDKAQQQKLRIISDKTISPYRTDQWGMIISRKSIHCQITTPSHNPQIKIRSFQAPLWEKKKRKEEDLFLKKKHTAHPESMKLRSNFWRVKWAYHPESKDDNKEKTLFTGSKTPVEDWDPKVGSRPWSPHHPRSHDCKLSSSPASCLSLSLSFRGASSLVSRLPLSWWSSK